MMSVLKEAKDTQGLNSGSSPNDDMASDISTSQFHAINDVCLHYVWFANTIAAKYVLKNRENDLYMYNSIVLWPSFK